MNWTTVFQIAVLLGGSGAIGAGVQSFAARRKVKAEGEASLSDAAMRQLSELQVDFEALKKENREFKLALRAHQRWDNMVILRLQQLGVDDIPDPPELWI